MWLPITLSLAQALPTAPPAAPAAAGPAPVSLQVEAARGTWQDSAPPATGWAPVQLPDIWSQRWPGFDGVVWYRLRWTEAGDATALVPRGLFIDGYTMAGAVFLNGSLIGTDRFLVEPLSRSWNRPRLWTLAPPMLRAGANELLVRVSGHAAYQGGLGTVFVGTQDQARAAYDASTLQRRSLQWFGFGLTLAMGVLFGMLWLLRRSEHAYGWFALHSLTWLVYAYNFIATEAWPLPDTHGMQRLTLVALLLSILCILAFAREFCHAAVSLPLRVAQGLGVGTALAVLLLPVGPMLSIARSGAACLALALFLFAVLTILRHAWHSRSTEALALALCVLLPVAAGVHDVLAFLQWLPGQRYYATPSSTAMLLGISFVLTWRLVQGLRLVEHFNQELRARVDEATARLSELMGRQHAAELLQTRLGERLSLVRDLHDGLGMTLSGHLSLLRQQPGEADSRALHALEEINQDLRLIIENSALEEGDSLAQRLAPLRHRSTRLLEAAGIVCHWDTQGLDHCQLDSRQALDLLRLLQEALTNVLRHSRATRVDIVLHADAGRLRLRVRDDGCGLPPSLTGPDARGATPGLGLRSMRARAARLQGMLHLHSDGRGTELQLEFALPSARSAATEAAQPSLS